MKKDRSGEKRPLSAGTTIMLALLVIVLAGSGLVIGKLSSGAPADLNKLRMDVLDLKGSKDEEKEASAKTMSPEKPKEEATKEKTAPTPQAVQVTKEPAPASAGGGFTLTVAGTLSLSGEVRKNCWNPDSKVNDYADTLMLLAPRINGDVNGVFAENIYSDSAKASDTVAPESAAGLLTEGRFTLAACGFSQAYARGADGISETRTAMLERGILPVGIREEDEQNEVQLQTVGGVKAAFLQYTGTIASKTRKKMAGAGENGTVPEAELSVISSDIEAARAQGAEVVIVFLNWGMTGKDPDKKQRELAEGIAASGADLIIGNGSLVPQPAEYLTGKDGGSVLCVWSLGSLLSGDRSNVKRMSGYLLHVTIRSNGRGGADVLAPEYTPVYTWKYKQDSRFYYRCIASDAEPPDGMDNEQRKNMTKSAEYVEEVLKGSPLTRRIQE